MKPLFPLLQIKSLVLLLLVAGLGVGCDSISGVIYEEVTSPEPFQSDALNFLVVGDWGRQGRYSQQDVAQQMGLTGAEINSRFVISTGDNFYPEGVNSINDRHWQRSFERVYASPALEVPWYVVLGNHDYDGNVQAQIDYTSKSSRWHLPARYYSVRQAVDDTTEALFLFLDTVLFHRGTEAEAAAQIEWLERELAETDAAWRIVVAHNPLYSADHKHGDAHALIDRLRPILERHDVQAYISGHAHSLQHLKPEGNVHYFISGAGSRTRSVDMSRDSQFVFGMPGFMAASLTADAMLVRFIDKKGRIYYETWVPRTRAMPERASKPARSTAP